MQNAPREHSAILSTSIKQLLLSLRPLFCLFLSGRLRQILLYSLEFTHTVQNKYLRDLQEQIVV